MNSDFAELLQAFENHEVEYLVVGGYAVMAYAEPRFTKDFDVWVNTRRGGSFPKRADGYFSIPAAVKPPTTPPAMAPAA